MKKLAIVIVLALFMAPGCTKKVTPEQDYGVRRAAAINHIYGLTAWSPENSDNQLVRKFARKNQFDYSHVVLESERDPELNKKIKEINRKKEAEYDKISPPADPHLREMTREMARKSNELREQLILDEIANGPKPDEELLKLFRDQRIQIMDEFDKKYKRGPYSPKTRKIAAK